LRRFYYFLRRHEFRVTVCKKCRQKIWPPSQNCFVCFSPTKLEKVVTTGFIKEITTSYTKGTAKLYGIVDMQGIKLVGSLSPDAYVGLKVQMTDCGIRENGSLFFNFDPYAE
jgi:uncharacterized OB-fold protein